MQLFFDLFVLVCPDIDKKRISKFYTYINCLFLIIPASPYKKSCFIEIILIKIDFCSELF